MDVLVTKKYLAMVFILWIAPIVCAIWGGPVWITISLSAFFLIYAGHEWIHAYVCAQNKVEVVTIYLSTGNESATEFEKPDDPAVEAKIYLAGVTYDSVLLTVIIINSMLYAVWFKQEIPFIFALSMMLITLALFSVPGSDWQNFLSCYREASKNKKAILGQG